MNFTHQMRIYYPFLFILLDADMKKKDWQAVQIFATENLQLLSMGSACMVIDKLYRKHLWKVISIKPQTREKLYIGTDGLTDSVHNSIDKPLSNGLRISPIDPIFTVQACATMCVLLLSILLTITLHRQLLHCCRYRDQDQDHSLRRPPCRHRYQGCQ